MPHHDSLDALDEAIAQAEGEMTPDRERPVERVMKLKRQRQELAAQIEAEQVAERLQADPDVQALDERVAELEAKLHDPAADVVARREVIGQLSGLKMQRLAIADRLGVVGDAETGLHARHEAVRQHLAQQNGSAAEQPASRGPTRLQKVAASMAAKRAQMQPEDGAE